MKHELWKQLKKELAIRSMVIDLQHDMVSEPEAVEMATKLYTELETSEHCASSAVIHDRVCGNSLIALEDMGYMVFKDTGEKLF